MDYDSERSNKFTGVCMSKMQVMGTFTVEKESRIGFADVSRVFPALEKNLRGTVLLETPTPGGNSILVWDPVATIAVYSDSVDVQTHEGVMLPPLPVRPSDVPQFLQETLSRYHVDTTEDESITLPFIGGFIGFVGYEWAAGQEGISNGNEPGVPDMWFGLYDRALVMNQRNEVFLISIHSMRSASTEDVRRQLYGIISRNIISNPVDAGAKDLNFSYDFPRDKFENGVREIRRSIRSGDVYQVNIAQRIRSQKVDPWYLYSKLKSVNPSPFSGILSTGDFTIVSDSPERVLRVDPEIKGERWVSTRPIAGTRPRGPGDQDIRNERALKTSPKERAEHTMLVDLSRNDLGRIAKSGSVEVDELLTIERYSHVMHLVSNVRGKLSRSAGIPDVFRAMLPGGSVTGTPKISANRVISEIEPVPRGAYTGSLGYISLNGSMDFNILIRSAYYPAKSKEMHVYAGSGIVQDSVPSREWAETREKAKAMLETIQNAVPSGYSWTPPNVHSSWKPPHFTPRFSEAKVLLIDNYDSFTYNLVQYLSALGAKVSVIRNDEATLSELKACNPTHVVISPGPGKPENSGISIPAIIAFQGIPTMGVCLGHQAIIEAYGGSLVRSHLPVHGKISKMNRIMHDGLSDMLNGLPSRFQAGRYHSLIAEDVPDSLLVTAITDDGGVMAVQHKSFPTFGVQFHPESILTPQGIRIFSNFLSSTHPGKVRQ